MEVPYWFNEKWIDTDAKALGVYIALLYLRLDAVYSNWSKDTTINSVKRELVRFLLGKEGYEAWKSAEAFIDNFYAHEYSSEDKRFKENTETLLDDIEGNGNVAILLMNYSSGSTI